jgi:hypothetical protein
MTTDTPDTSNPDFIPVPAEVQAIFDKADESGLYAAKILSKSVQLTSRDGLTVYEEVSWPDAFRWMKNAIAILARVTNDPAPQHTP